jgi:hypothetical protein
MPFEHVAKRQGDVLWWRKRVVRRAVFRPSASIAAMWTPRKEAASKEIKGVDRPASRLLHLTTNAEKA